MPPANTKSNLEPATAPCAPTACQGKESPYSFFDLLENMTKQLKHSRLAEVFRTIGFKPHETYGPHSHLRFEINYVKRGSCILRLDGESEFFHSGEMMILCPHVPHAFEAGKEGVTLLQLEFLPEVFGLFETHDTPASMLSTFIRGQRMIRIPAGIRIMQTVQHIVDELIERKVYHRGLVLMYYAELLILIVRHLSEIYLPKGHNPTLPRAISYISTVLSDPQLRIEDIARHVGVSERYLRRVFQTTMKLSPMVYLNRQRVNHAIELLKNTSLSLKEISFECGFISPQQFTRTFKRLVNMRPSEFR